MQPPCWRYRGGSFTKKIENPKIANTWFFVLPYFELFGSHATSNFSLYRYIYIYIRANLRPPCRRYKGSSSTKKIDNPKILDMWFFVFRYFQPFGSHATSNFYIYRYIYIITVILRPTFWRYGDVYSTKITQPLTLLYIIYIYLY